jgi:O-acetyl-ADP-ribose deacetylase (regulator of RNase III)
MRKSEPMLESAKGNLLEADVEALVNTVNTEGVMGKGIALQFKKKYPDMFAAYRAACHAGEVVIGRMNVFERRDMLNPRFIINFPTKQHWRSPARMEDIEAGLAALVGEVRKRGIKSLAVPPGHRAGLGRLGRGSRMDVPARRRSRSGPNRPQDGTARDES